MHLYVHRRAKQAYKRSKGHSGEAQKGLNVKITIYTMKILDNPLEYKLPDYLTRFVSISPSGCWLWLGNIANGYGIANLWREGIGETLAHRIVWELVNNKKVPDKHHLHHKCLNRRCCNPAHLEILSSKEHRGRHNARNAAIKRIRKT